MSYDLPVKRCYNLDDHAEHSWEFKGEIHLCPGMPAIIHPEKESGDRATGGK
jgi:hypothetical protein